MGSMKELVVPAFDATTTACRVMASLERAQVFVRRAETLDLVATRTRLLSDLATHRTLTGDVEAARAASEGTLALVQLFDRGTQDRKELETLICAALRDKGRLLAFTSSELLLDADLVAMLGEGDRCEGTRRADVYMIAEAGAITFDAYALAATAGQATTFFKHACTLGLVVGASVKSDFGFRNRRASSGELHLDRCPIVLFALPRFNERAGVVSDMVVCANVCPRFSVSAGAIRYVGAASDCAGGSIRSVDEVRCAEALCAASCGAQQYHPPPAGRACQPSASRWLLSCGTSCFSSRWERRGRTRWTIDHSGA